MGRTRACAQRLGSNTAGCAPGVQWCARRTSALGSEMPGKKILMLVGEFTEEYEIFVFQQALEAVGHTVHVVCPDKKAGDVIATSSTISRVARPIPKSPATTSF
jgi:hypothetical protein